MLPNHTEPFHQSPSAHLTRSPLARLLQLGWSCRRSGWLLLTLNGVLLALSLWTLELAGAGIDLVRAAYSNSPWRPSGLLGILTPSTATPTQQLFGIALLILGCSAALAYLKYVTASVAARASQTLLTELRSQVYDKLQRMSFTYFDQTDTGSLINRASSDVLAVKTFVDGVLLKLISVAMALGAFVTYMVQVHATLTLACLATTPLLCLATVSFSRLVQPQYRRSSTLSDQLIQILSESFHGVQVVKGFNAEPNRVAVFLSKSEQILSQRALIFRITSVFQPVMGFLPQVNQFVLLLFGGYLVVNGDLSLGTGLFVFANLLQDFANQVGQLTNIANTAQTCLAGAERVFEVLDATPESDSPEDTTQQPALRGSIRFENVTSGYRDTPVLRDISFEVRPGECIGITGPTGSGKSTVLNLIPRFYETTSGRIILDGHDLRELDLRHLRRNIGVVFQEPFLFNNTIAANIAFGCPTAAPRDIRRAAHLAAADGFIASLPQGYETIIGENGTNLSGGQRQRIALARTLLLDPPILLIDDTTSAVDSKTEREIHESIFTVLQSRTSIVVSNRLSTLIHMDRILVMHDGRIVEEGSPTSLLQNGHFFRRLVMSQLDNDGVPMTAASWSTTPEDTRSDIESPLTTKHLGRT